MNLDVFVANYFPITRQLIVFPSAQVWFDLIDYSEVLNTVIIVSHTYLMAFAKSYFLLYFFTLLEQDKSERS